MSRVNMQRARFAKRFLAGVALLLVGVLAAASAQADTVIFSDDFDGTALNATWTPSGSPEVDATSSLIVDGGKATFHSGTAGYNYVSMWGDTSQLAGLGSSTDWTAEVAFTVTGYMKASTADGFSLLTGRRTAGAAGLTAGIDFRLLDNDDPNSGTFRLGWYGQEDGGNSTASVIASGLAKDVEHIVSAHRKSDGTVDISLDGGSPISQAVLGSLNPLMWRFGEPSGYASVDNVSLNYVRTSLVPEPGSMALLVMAGLGLLAYAWRKRK